MTRAIVSSLYGIWNKLLVGSVFVLEHWTWFWHFSSSHFGIQKVLIWKTIFFFLNPLASSCFPNQLDQSSSHLGRCISILIDKPLYRTIHTCKTLRLTMCKVYLPTLIIIICLVIWIYVVLLAKTWKLHVEFTAYCEFCDLF